MSDTGSGPDELAPSPTDNPAATAPGGVAAEEPVATATTGYTPGGSHSMKKRRWWMRRYTFSGTAVGLVFWWLSMTPSLLPRGPLAMPTGGSPFGRIAPMTAKDYPRN